MIVLWCAVHISSPRPHTFRYSLHNPHRAIVPLFARVHCFNPASSITEARFRYFSVPSGFASTRNPKHTHISFVLLCVCQSSSPPFAYCCRVAEELLTVHQAFHTRPTKAFSSPGVRLSSIRTAGQQTYLLYTWKYLRR